MINLFMVLWTCVVAVLCFFYLAPKLKYKTRAIFFVIGVIAIFAMALTVKPIKSEPNGKALTELNSGGVYFTEWAQIKGQTVSMKLNLGEKSLSLYYEIPEDKIIFWGEEDKKVPPNFRVLTDKEGKVYALKPVK